MTPTTVTSSATVYTSPFPHTSVIFPPQQKGPKTRSSTGTLVKSTHMKVCVSPDKSLQVHETDATSPGNATKLLEIAESLSKIPPLAPATKNLVPSLICVLKSFQLNHLLILQALPSYRNTCISTDLINHVNR